MFAGGGIESRKREEDELFKAMTGYFVNFVSIEYVRREGVRNDRDDVIYELGGVNTVTFNYISFTP